MTSGPDPSGPDGTLLGEDGVRRCPWAGTPGTMRDYHDTEWGLPVTDERGLFERLSLEGFQAGLSWSTILNKRERFREVFHGFDPDAVAAMGPDDVERLLTDTGIVRNRAKVEATLRNARATLALRDEEGLVALVAGFAPAADPEPRVPAEVPTTSPGSAALSKELRRRGFGFVDTHLLACHRRGCAR